MRLFFIGILIAIISVFIDQYSKYMILELFNNTTNHYIKILPGFNIVLVYNRGVSFGLFNNIENAQLILSVIAIIIVVGLVVWLSRIKDTYESIAISLIIGGAIGNIIDRIRLGYVVDFLDFYVNDYHWPAFNYADSVVFIGVFLIIFENIFNRKKHENYRKRKIKEKNKRLKKEREKNDETA